MSDWGPPAGDDVQSFRWVIIRTGMYFMIITSVLFGFLFWAAAKILEDSEIISGSLSWRYSIFFGFVSVFVTIWKKTFFR